MENTPLLHHLADMVLTYKIVTGKELVSKETWFRSPAEPETSGVKIRGLDTFLFLTSDRGLE